MESFTQNKTLMNIKSAFVSVTGGCTEKLERYISIFICSSFTSCRASCPILGVQANSKVQNETTQNMASHLGLYCLHKVIS